MEFNTYVMLAGYSTQKSKETPKGMGYKKYTSPTQGVGYSKSKKRSKSSGKETAPAHGRKKKKMNTIVEKLAPFPTIPP